LEVAAARTQKGELDPVNWWLVESFDSHRDYESVTSAGEFHDVRRLLPDGTKG
jgi:hypothetical protein